MDHLIAIGEVASEEADAQQQGGQGGRALPGLLNSLGAYPQIRLSLGDLMVMAGQSATRRHALRQLRRRQFKPTMAGTLA